MGWCRECKKFVWPWQSAVNGNPFLTGSSIHVECQKRALSAAALSLTDKTQEAMKEVREMTDEDYLYEKCRKAVYLPASSPHGGILNALEPLIDEIAALRQLVKDLEDRGPKRTKKRGGQGCLGSMGKRGI
jgi:hypothetical protein